MSLCWRDRCGVVRDSGVREASVRVVVRTCPCGRAPYTYWCVRVACGRLLMSCWHEPLPYQRGKVRASVCRRRV